MKAGSDSSYFSAGRSPVFARGGMVATSQPLAAQAGLWVLREGGNALEACLCAAATLNVVEPQSTGVGGDMFLLYWDEEKKKLLGLNASGRAPRRAGIEALAERGLSEIPAEGILAVTVPGAVDGWWEAHRALASGRIPWARLFEPAIEYAEGGFPLSPIIANAWRRQEGKLGIFPASARTYLPEGRAPRAGEVFRNPGLARTLRLLATGGREAFYEGPIAEAIVAASRELGGFLEMEDLRGAHATWVEPLSARYRGYEVHELPPNGQGLAALLCLNVLEGLEVGRMEYASPDHLHLLIEAMKLAFADRDRYVADPEFTDLPLKGLLDEAYTLSRRARLDRERAAAHVEAGLPPGWGDTIYCCAADGRGNLCSFINSLFHHFGSGVTAGETGVVLQNRGTGFSLDPSHPNCLEGGKRPFHTIIPGFLTRDGKPVMPFGVMGRDMQPQGHVQLLSNLLDFGMDVQAAMDAPRFRILGGREVAIEQGVPDGVLAELSRRGHRVAREGGYEGFGGGQAIWRLESGAYVAGSDRRRDGCAVGF